MTTASPEDQQRLLSLQALDTRAQQLVHARKTHPAIAKVAELDKQIGDLHGSLVDSRTAVSDLEREMAKAEADVAQVVARTEMNQRRLESEALSAKDTMAVTDELESLARRTAALEEIQLDVMERLEAHQESLDQVESAHQALVDAKTAAEAERDAAFAEIDAQRKELAAERADAVTTIDAGLVKLYEQIRGRVGAGAAALRGGRCEGCGLELNPVDLSAARSAAPEQVVRCEDCGRILVRLPETTA